MGDRIQFHFDKNNPQAKPIKKERWREGRREGRVSDEKMEVMEWLGEKVRVLRRLAQVCSQHCRRIAE